MTSRRLAAVALAMAGLLGTSACAGSTGDADVASAENSQSVTPSSTTSSSPTRSAAPARTPQVGDCYRIGFAQATKAVSDARPVDCAQPHTATTAFVGTIDPYEDGHLLAVDSDRVQQRIAQACPAKVDAYVGGSQEQQRISRVRAVWFSPTLQQADDGATWYRCDVVAVGATDELADLPVRLKGALGAPRGDQLATCGTAAPDKKGFAPVACGQTHAWRAVATVALPEKATYLGKAAGSDADDSCKGIAADRATDPLSYTWSFQWPSREDWDSGQRYGLCWVPDKN